MLHLTSRAPAGAVRRLQSPPAQAWSLSMTYSRASSGATESRLAVNYLPVRYSAGTFLAGMVVYETVEQLEQLRTELAGTHVVVRADGQIACVPLTVGEPGVGKKTALEVRDNPRLAARLVQES